MFQVAKKLVNSDFKNNRVEDPTNINEKQQKKVKKFCKEYFDKAVIKQRAHDKKKAGKQEDKGTEHKAENGAAEGESEDEGVDMKMSDDEGEGDGGEKEVSETGGTLKRKREDGQSEDGMDQRNGTRSLSPSKRQRSSTPPPPPPPPMSPGEPEDQSMMQDEHEDESTPAATQSLSQSPLPPPPPPPPLLPTEQ